MMPKGFGWLGPLQNPNGGISTELSIEDESGMFPAIVPTLTPQQLQTLLSLTDKQPIPNDIYKAARAHADKLRSQGRSTFREIWE